MTCVKRYERPIKSLEAAGHRELPDTKHRRRMVEGKLKYNNAVKGDDLNFTWRWISEQVREISLSLAIVSQLCSASHVMLLSQQHTKAH